MEHSAGPRSDDVSLPARDDDKGSQSKIDAMQCFTHNVSLCVSVSVRVVCEWVRSWWAAWKGRVKDTGKKAFPPLLALRSR